MTDTNQAETDRFSVEVGERLRSIRQLRKLSLGDVERESNGAWSASAIGAYERGFRNLSLPRLRDLAQFYDVPMSMLLGEDEFATNGDDDRATKIVLDLVALADVTEAKTIHRYARSIVLDRRDFNGRVLSLRRDDLRAIAALMDTTVAGAMDNLRGWKVLVDL